VIRAIVLFHDEERATKGRFSFAHARSLAKNVAKVTQRSGDFDVIGGVDRFGNRYSAAVERFSLKKTPALSQRQRAVVEYLSNC